MATTTPRRPIERPPNKIAGMVYIVIGFIALCTAAFVLFYQGTVVGPITNLRTGVGIVIIVYGVFRIFTGISTIRRANKLNTPVVTSGKNSEPTQPQP
jgi:hypothetical protein